MLKLTMINHVKSQKGFGVINLLAIIVVLGLVALVGWLVYQKSVNADLNPSLGSRFQLRYWLNRSYKRN